MLTAGQLILTPSSHCIYSTVDFDFPPTFCLSAGCQLYGTSRESKQAVKKLEVRRTEVLSRPASPPRLVQSGVLMLVHVTFFRDCRQRRRFSSSSSHANCFQPLQASHSSHFAPLPLPLPRHLHYYSVHERISQLTLTLLAEDCARVTLIAITEGPRLFVLSPGALHLATFSSPSPAQANFHAFARV
jgi:hypothetical protein